MASHGKAAETTMPSEPRYNDKITTTVDEADMWRMGKAQDFHRGFRFLSITAFSVVAICGWCYAPGTLTTAIDNGGTGGLIVIYLVNWAGLFTVVLSLAEMSSMAPTAGGQYHWASEFAPASMQKLLSYLAGWLSSISWAAGFASASYLIGLTYQGLILVNNPTFTPQPYQAYLFVVLIATFSLAVNTLLARWLPRLEPPVFFLFAAAFISFMAVYWTIPPRLTASQVFGTFTNGSGYNSLGLSILSGQSALLFLIVGSDSTAHLAEETKYASTIVPKAMVMSYLLNGALTFIVLVTYCFLLVDYTAAQNSPVGLIGLPNIQVLTSSISSTSGGTAILAILTIIQTLGLCNWMASTARQVFAFARDRGLPFGAWIGKVNQEGTHPRNSLLVVYFFTILIPLISLGSSVAFDALTSLQIIAMIFTYLITLSCIIWRRLVRRKLPSATWSLGWAGLPINLLGWCYCVYLVTFLPWPVEIPVTPQNFNWSSVMFVGVMAFVALYYVVWARRVYSGPVMLVRARDE